MAIKDNNLDIISQGKGADNLDIIFKGVSHLQNNLWITLRGRISSFNDLGITLKGKAFDEQAVTLKSKNLNEINVIIKSITLAESLSVYSFSEDEITDFSITAEQPVNEITIQYSYDWAEGRFMNALTKHNPLSKLLYGEAKKTLELKMIQHTRQAEKIADAILYTSSIPQIMCSFKHNLRSLYLEVGDIVSITHRAGLGKNGWQKALGIVTSKRLSGITIDYEVIMNPSDNLYKSELLTLTQTASPGQAGITITYEHGVATITIYADIKGYPPVEGAEVTIAGVRKVTDRNGQVRFNLEPGTYTAYIRASGYEDAEVTFRV